MSKKKQSQIVLEKQSDQGLFVCFLQQIIYFYKEHSVLEIQIKFCLLRVTGLSLTRGTVLCPSARFVCLT